MLPPWEEIRRDYIETGLPHRLVVRNSPGLHAFTDSSASRLGARFELAIEAGSAPVSRLEQIMVSEVSVDGGRWLEIATASPRLYESFYRLIEQVTAAVLAGLPPHAALEQAVGLWDSLVEEVSILSEERQAGLFGELLFLERLILNGTPDAISSWVGPDRQPHDFRLGTLEFEVKTTSGARRVHTINGLGQLEPSLACTLYLVSIQTTDAGTGGRSLPDLVDNIDQLLSDPDRKEFLRRLELSGFIQRHRTHYSRRRRLRTDMALIVVQDGTPRLTPDALANIPARFVAERIGAVVYDVNVSGLGVLDGSPEFQAIIPSAKGAA